jgi:hypothetical protein
VVVGPRIKPHHRAHLLLVKRPRVIEQEVDTCSVTLPFEMSQKDSYSCHHFFLLIVTGLPRRYCLCCRFVERDASSMASRVLSAAERDTSGSHRYTPLEVTAVGPSKRRLGSMWSGKWGKGGYGIPLCTGTEKLKDLA